MVICSLAAKVPSLCITNDHFLSRLRELNPTVPPGVLRHYERQLRHLFARCGAQARYYRDRASGETALDLIMAAAREALVEADLTPAQLDLIIYCGVGRAFLEPATAYFVSRALGTSCDCFDLLDACMSWVRALHVAHNFLATRTYSRVLVVNGEFNTYEHGYPDLLRIDSPEKLRYTFPALTIGEAATATVLTHSNRQWNFHFRSDPTRVHLCSVPLTGYDDYVDKDDPVALNGAGNFVSFGQDLLRIGLETMDTFVREVYPNWHDFDIWFPHAAAADVCRAAAERLKLGDKLYWRVFPEYGNLVSASIPTAMWMARREGALARGHRTVLCPVSAGMAFALVDFEY